VKIANTETASKIRVGHLEREAWVYVRQSSLHQVENHHESRRRQYGLGEWAVDLGWSKERIQVVDEDQGKSSMTPDGRVGFARILKAVGRGDVGIVIALEASRLARNSPDWHLLMYLCRWTGTLIADEHGIHDPKDSADRMTLNLRGQMSELELDGSIHRMTTARWNKAERGELLTVPPAGYDIDDFGQLMITSDESVAHAIRTVFRKFDELGAARQVYVWWREEGLLYPVRRKELKSHPVVWVRPTYGRVKQTLNNPIFAGVYAFGKSQSVRIVEDGDPPKVTVRRRARQEWPVLIRDHHPAYISFEKYLEIQERLKRNQGSIDRCGKTEGGAVREGRTLLQGLVRCGVCGRGMYVSYGGRRPGQPKEKATFQYSCRGERDELGAKVCQVVGGSRIDALVVAAFLEVTRPAGIEAAVLAEEQVRKEAAELERSWQLQIEKADYEARRAERQYNAVEPENRVVVRELERRWNAKLEELASLEKEAESRLAAQRPLTEAEVEHARRLGEDLDKVWESETTTDRDRKRLLRTLIEEVQLRTQEKHYDVRVVWKGGSITDRQVVRQPWKPAHATSEDTVELIRKLAAEFDDTQIACVLNKQGRRSGYGKPFTKQGVRSIRKRNGIARGMPLRARDPREGPFTADEAGRELGVSIPTIHRWLRDGILPGKQVTPGAPWRIVLTEELRRRLTVGDAPKGWVGLLEASKRLGLPKSQVAHLVKAGKLAAVRTRVGKRDCWRIDVNSADCGRQPELFQSQNK
jgi:DNA invertase Pin-like site-specific DNA recombinase